MPLPRGDAPAVRATVMLTTKNRCDELRTALQSAVTQTEPIEVLVIDDGSTDATSAMVAAEFPGVRLVRHQESRGYIACRNEGMRLARGPIVFSIDDDAAFSTSETIRQTLAEFEPARVAAVAIPFIDVNTNPRIQQRAPDGSGVYLTGRFIGTAHALRRDVFERVGGYREDLTHQGEEGDLCIRMLDAGHVVRLGTADPIHHFESPRRDRRRMDYYGVRNAIRFVWQNVPLPFLLVHMPVTAARLLAWTLEPARLKVRVSGLVAGLLACRPSLRHPVSRDAYTLFRRLERAPRLLEDVP
jgi:glycosyltransferase involved in cell wall biosynthesis